MRKFGARAVSRNVVRDCVPCFRFKPRLAEQIMADLPKDRVTACQPFHVTGVDLCGPIYTTVKIRGKPPVKTYVSMFVCFASKADRLEALSDLRTDCFLCTLNRFIGRGGRPQIIWCDNATHFVGAANVWSDNAKIRLKEATASSGITFRFIPPRALRRPLEGSNEVRKDVVAENNRQRSTDVRRADDVPGPSRIRPELAADRGSQRRHKRRGRSNSWTLAHRAVAASAARDRRQQGWLLESISEALVTQGALLGRVAAGFLGEHAVQEQMHRGRPQYRSGRGGHGPRRQHSTTEVDNWQNQRSGGRGRRKGPRGRGKNTKRQF